MPLFFEKKQAVVVLLLLVSLIIQLTISSASFTLIRQITNKERRWLS